VWCRRATEQENVKNECLGDAERRENRSREPSKELYMICIPRETLASHRPLTMLPVMGTPQPLNLWANLMGDGNGAHTVIAWRERGYLLDVLRWALEQRTNPGVDVA
jgi:hypothetical protein